MNLDYEEFQIWLEHKSHLLLWLLWQMPLMSQSEMADISGLGRDRVAKLLISLQDENLVAWGALGRTRGVVKRYALTAGGVMLVANELGIPVEWQVTATGIRWGIRRLAIYEAFYDLLAKFARHPGVQLGGVIREPADPTDDPVRFTADARVLHFRWMQRGPIDAVVRFSNGAWFPMVWLGTTHTRHRIMDKARDATALLEKAHPAGWLIIGSDRLAATLAAQIWEADQVLAVSTDGFVERRMKPGQCFPWNPPAQSMPANLGRPEDAFRWAERNPAIQALNGALQHEVFRYILDYVAATPAQLRLRFGESGRRAHRLLVKHGLIVKIDGGFYPTKAGARAAAQEDRISLQRLWRRLEVYLDEEGEYRKDQQTHDRILVDVERKLYARRCRMLRRTSGPLEFPGVAGRAGAPPPGGADQTGPGALSGRRRQLYGADLCRGGALGRFGHADPRQARRLRPRSTARGRAHPGQLDTRQAGRGIVRQECPHGSRHPDHDSARVSQRLLLETRQRLEDCRHG